MYRLRSHINDSLTLHFDCIEDMQAYVTQHDIVPNDMTMEYWHDDRIMPGNSAWMEVEY